MGEQSREHDLKSDTLVIMRRSEKETEVPHLGRKNRNHLNDKTSLTIKLLLLC